jgi:hypothetical protein
VDVSIDVTADLADGSLVVVLHRGSAGNDIVFQAGAVGLLDTPKLAHNLWSQADIADFKAALTQRVQPRETILLKIQSS